MYRVVGIIAGVALWTLLSSTGCVQELGAETVYGPTSVTRTVADEASVTVVAPSTNLPVAGGTPVEVSFRAQATTPSGSVDIFFDPDTDPNNGNEIVQQAGLALATTSALLDTSDLNADTYAIGVRVREFGTIAAVGYSPGRIIINQRSRLTFTSPRGNFTYDRSNRIAPEFEVAWTINDPDVDVTTGLTVDVFLDASPELSGDEVLLYTNTHVPDGSGTFNDSFTFQLRTDLFEPGTYRIVATVTDGVGTASFLAPGSIVLRARLAGVRDLRDLDDPQAELQGAIFEGFNPGDNAGSFISTLRDVDQDGFDDFVILAQFAKPNYLLDPQRNGVGEVYFVYGRPQRFSGRINLNSTGTLFRGDIFTGIESMPNPVRPSRGAKSFAMLSDWDGDGLREIAFGFPFVDSRGSRDISGTGTFAPLDPSGFFRTGGVVVASSSMLLPDLGFPGRQVKNLGAIGADAHMNTECIRCDFGGCTVPMGFYGPKPEPSGCGPTFFNQNLDVSTSASARNLGCRFSTNVFGDMFGESIAAYDFEGILISAPNRNPSYSRLSGGPDAPGAGVISLYFRNTTFVPWSTVNAPGEGPNGYPGVPEVDYRNIPHGGPYFYIMDDYTTYNVYTFFDPNMVEEVANSVPEPCNFAPIGDDIGQWLLFCYGTPGYITDDDGVRPVNYNINNNVPGPERTVRFWSGTPGAALNNVATIGDFSADGLTDLAIGAPYALGGRGACFIVLGRLRNLMWGSEVQVEELGLGTGSSGSDLGRVFDGIRVVGAPGDHLGQSQDAAGDFNGDGVEDVLIGSPMIQNRAGGAAVFFGSREVINLSEEEIPFEQLPARGLGVIFVGEDEGDQAGLLVRGVGDVDNDGIDDIMIAAPDRSVRLDTDNDGTVEIDRTQCGVVYLIYGGPHVQGTLDLSMVGSEQLPGAVFVGRNSNDQLGAALGEQGDRSVGMNVAGDVDGDGAIDLIFSAIKASPRDRQSAGEAYLVYGIGE